VAFFRTLDLSGAGAFPVAWAARRGRRNWFDIAREYTERWHHSQQIFEAVGRPSPLLSRRLYLPVLETFLRALPFTFRDASRADGHGRSSAGRWRGGGEWLLLRQGGVWVQVASAGVQQAATVTLPQEVAWKVWSKRRPVGREVAVVARILIEGDAELGRIVVGYGVVMA